MTLPTAVPGGAPISPLRRMILSHGLLAYFVMAFAFAWLAVLPLLLARNGLLGLPANLPVEPFQIAGAFAGPTLAAFIVTAVQSGRSGVRRLLGRYVQWRAGMQWYLLVLFGPLLALTIGAIPFLGVSILSAFIDNAPLIASFFLPVLVVGIILGPLWEEPGWRGFALPRLERRYGPLAGTIILGLLWSLWHLPAFLGGWLGPLTLSTFSAQLVGTVASSIIITWVYNNTRGSLLLMILLHASFNAALAFGGRILPSQLPAATANLVNSGWIPALTYTAWALLLILITRGRLSYGPAVEA